MSKKEEEKSTGRWSRVIENLVERKAERAGRPAPELHC